MKYPESVLRLIDHFNKLPGIGPKTAERLVLALIRKNKDQVLKFSKDLEAITYTIDYCPNCHNLSEVQPCQICKDQNRDQSKLCIIAKPQDLIALEATGSYNGYYHVLWGYLNPIEGKTPEQLKIKELEDRLNKMPHLNEVILAFNYTMDGESTMHYISKLLEEKNINVTRLGRGLSMGSELEYADDLTISNALKWRTKF